MIYNIDQAQGIAKKCPYDQLQENFSIKANT